jgi:REP element-mobilizing transposase RayT
MRHTRPRLDAACYLGPQRYFVTLCCDFRHAAFVAAEVTLAVIAQFLRAATERQFAVIAYTFMPDHSHALVEGQDVASDLQSLMHHAKQLTAFEYKKAQGRRLWQPSFHDRVLRSDEGTWDVVRYICENPVRKGLVEVWDQYEFTGSGIMTKRQLAEELMLQPRRAWRP